MHENGKRVTGTNSLAEVRKSAKKKENFRVLLG